MKSDSENQIPKIFLVGPPGVGKSSLGEKACQALDLRFLDLSMPAVSEQSTASRKEILIEAINAQHVDIVAIPWAIQRDKDILTWLRRSGVLLLLWAHPLDMQARSEHSKPLFTPSCRIKTRGGFGRNGTGSLEFRSLDRAANEVLLLVNRSFDEAVRYLQHRIVRIREESIESPIIRSGLSAWADEWMQRYDFDKDIASIIVDAMARYLLHLQSEGKSQRTLSGVCSDLQAAGTLVVTYDWPEIKNKSILLDFFSYPPWTIEFRRKFSDSDNAVARYVSNLKGFARFLTESGEKAK